MNNTSNPIGAIILAAGKGKRMQSTEKNKVSMVIADKPLVVRIVHMFQSAQINTIVVVVGFAKESVVEALVKENVLYADQAEQLGTAHATERGLAKLSSTIQHVMVIYGDDATIYPQALLETFIDHHQRMNAVVTFITFTLENPVGLGRVLRDKYKNVIGIVEEKNATEEQKQIKEINSGFYIFDRTFLESYLPQIEQNDISGEYYLTDIVELALKNNLKVETVQAGDHPWRGVNTPEELQEAEKMFGR